MISLRQDRKYYSKGTIAAIAIALAALIAPQMFQTNVAGNAIARFDRARDFDHATIIVMRGGRDDRRIETSDSKMLDAIWLMVKNRVAIDGLSKSLDNINCSIYFRRGSSTETYSLRLLISPNSKNVNILFFSRNEDPINFLNYNVDSKLMSVLEK